VRKFGLRKMRRLLSTARRRRGPVRRVPARPAARLPTVPVDALKELEIVVLRALLDKIKVR